MRIFYGMYHKCRLIRSIGSKVVDSTASVSYIIKFEQVSNGKLIVHGIFDIISM